MLLNKALVFLVLLSSLSAAHGLCQLETGEQYPGWEVRYNSSAAKGSIIKDKVNGTFGMGDLSLEVLQILGEEIVNVRISKRGVYEEDFSIGKSDNNFDITLADIRVKTVEITTSTVNLTIFTHNQAVVNATADITYGFPDINASLPNEEVEIDVEVKNLGELEAENLQLREDFGGLEVISRDSSLPAFFCGNSSFDLEYTIKAPRDIREDTNYTIYLTFTYSDSNPRLKTAKERKTEIPIIIAIKPTRVTLAKSAGNFTLLNPGREVSVTNFIENRGNTTAFNLKLIDTPPSDFEVVTGQPSLDIGRVYPGEAKRRSYTVISNDPIYCVSSSKISYQDELGNEYTTFSDRTLTRFSPFVTVTKIIKDLPISENLSYTSPFIKTRRSMRSNFSAIKPASVEFTADAILKTFAGETYFSLCQGSFLNGSPTICIDNEDEEPKVLINRSSEITVAVKNVGNTIARDINLYEIITNANYSGNTSWKGTLLPGEQASYTFTAVPVRKPMDITTVASYSDIEPLSLLTQEEIEGSGAGLCTKKLGTISFETSGNFSFTLPDLHIFQPERIFVYEDSKFDFRPVISNNGTEKIFDIEISIDNGDLTLIGGEKVIKLDELGRGFKPYKESGCNVEEWRNINITRTRRLLGFLSLQEMIYEIKNGDINVYVEGKPVTFSQDCEDDGLEISHDITLFQRYPFHSPPEPRASSVTAEEISFKVYGNPVQPRLAFWTPAVANQTVLPIKTAVTYEDFYGKRYTKDFTTEIVVLPSTAAFAFVRLEREDIRVTINYTNETELDEPGQLNFELASIGFGPIDKYTLNLSLPNNIEVASNDTNWTGRIEAQIRRVNDTLFVFSGDISRTSNISTFGKELLPLTIRGRIPGKFEIPYIITFDNKKLEGNFTFKVRGPALRGTKIVSNTTVNQDEVIDILLVIKNTGDANASNVIISDGVPAQIPIVSGLTQISLELLEPGEEVNLSYKVRAATTADLGGTRISWQDSLGNSYIDDLEPITLTVLVPKTPPPLVTEPPPATPGIGRIFPQDGVPVKERVFIISSREGLGALALTVVVLAIIIKLITVRVPLKEEE